MKILIVDDEYYIVQGIINNIDWKALGIQEVYSAYSVDQAIKIFEEQSIDLLITDIEMPRKSGLELIQWVNEQDLSTIKLLLTGHENFAYAQKAIDLKCFRYIVKPVQPKKLQEIVEEAIELVSHNQSIQRAHRFVNSWNNEVQLKYDRFWSELFNFSDVKNAANISNLLERYDLPSTWSTLSFRFFFICVYPTYQETAEAAHIGRYLQLSPYFEELLSFISAEKIIVIADPTFEIQTDTLAQFMNENFTSSPFIIFQEDTISLSDATTKYYEILNLFKNSFSITNVFTTLKDGQESLSFQQLSLEQLNFKQWPELIHSNQGEAILNEINQLFIRKSALYYVNDLRIIFHSLIHAFIEVMDLINADYKVFLAKTNATENDLIVSSSRYFLDWAKEALAKIQMFLQANNEADSFLLTIKQYIINNLSSPDLNRNSLSDVVHMNPDYISHLFHKQTGIHLNTYINNERIQLAKKLLLSTNLTLQEVATATGYSTPSYFHRQFKKATGMTPQQFKGKE